MKPILITIAFIAVFSVAKAQKIDTTIYSGCKLATDTTLTKGSPGILDSCPQFKNGFADLNGYISTHIRYQNITKPFKKDVRVIVEIVIEKDGSVSHVRVARPVFDGLDKEALRVVSSLPNWKPGILNGQNVRVRYWVVVPFKSTY